MYVMSFVSKGYGLRITAFAGAMLCAVTLAAQTNPTAAAANAITAAEVLGHIKVLSSDEYEGRLPGTHGGDLAVKYITGQFKSLRLAPGNPDGSYVQAVSLTGIRAAPTGSFTAGGHTIALDFPKDAVAVTERFLPEVAVKDSDLVFVGYGVVAPEYGWDDYKGVAA
jgi:hypothetical protein